MANLSPPPPISQPLSILPSLSHGIGTRAYTHTNTQHALILMVYCATIPLFNSSQAPRRVSDPIALKRTPEHIARNSACTVHIILNTAI